jgi:hypothetical protein
MKRCIWLLSLLACQSLAFAQEATVSVPLAESPIGYATVQEAYEALEADPSATQSEHEGWTSFNQMIDGSYIIWSFTPEDHAVHPTAVRREIVNKDGEVSISMAVLCHSSRLDCDQLIEQFRLINENLKRKLSGND